VNNFWGVAFDNPFIINALLAGLLASIASGVVGTYVVTRRITFIAGSISHFILGGMGLARYLNVVHQWEFATPFSGATLSAILAALIIGYVSLKVKEREDTIIGALWAIGMAGGIIFISQTPGYNVDLMSYLFGNILMVAPGDLWAILGLDIIVVTVSVLFYRQLLAVCFDEEFARLRGVNAQFFYLLLLCLTALTVVLLITVVGIVLVIALLTLPAGTAGFFTRKLWKMMLLATLFSVIYIVAGLAVSFTPNLPAGSMIILVAGGGYLGGLIMKGKILK
jgi:zinc transport system permease protein